MARVSFSFEANIWINYSPFLLEMGILGLAKVSLLIQTHNYIGWSVFIVERNYFEWLESYFYLQELLGFAGVPLLLMKLMGVAGVLLLIKEMSVSGPSSVVVKKKCWD